LLDEGVEVVVCEREMVSSPSLFRAVSNVANEEGLLRSSSCLALLLADADSSLGRLSFRYDEKSCMCSINSALREVKASSSSSDSSSSMRTSLAWLASTFFSWRKDSRLCRASSSKLSIVGREGRGFDEISSGIEDEGGA